MAVNSRDWEKKIEDNSLRKFVDSGRKEKLSVIVEVEAPEPIIEITPNSKFKGAVSRPVSVTYTEGMEKIEQDAIVNTKMLLKSLGLANRFLKSSRVFLVGADPSQLRTIAAAPTVRSIIPNRKITRLS